MSVALIVSSYKGVARKQLMTRVVGVCKSTMCTVRSL